jgi:hypothetical protein
MTENIIGRNEELLKQITEFLPHLSKDEIIEIYDMFHDLSDCFDLMTKEEMTSLSEDVKKNGIIEKIVLLNGKILDGRNRYIACRIVNVKPTYAKFEERRDPLNYVVSKNVKRRMLTVAQRLDSGLRILEKRKKRREIEIEKKKLELEKEGKQVAKELISKKEKKILENKDINEVARELGTQPKKLRQAKIIKKAIKKNPTLNKDWQKAKKGKTTTKAIVRQKIKKLPKQKTKADIIKQLKDERKKLTIWITTLWKIMHNKMTPEEILTDTEDKILSNVKTMLVKEGILIKDKNGEDVRK